MPGLSKNIKQIIKRGVQHAASRFGKHVRKSKSPQLLVLMYHRVLPEEDQRSLKEEPGMIVTPESFRLHMTTLKRYFNMIQLSEWINMKDQNEALPALACAITFDDGWADNYEHAYPILKELNIPATIFLVSDMIGTNKQFWPERMANVISTIASECPEQWQHPLLDWIVSSKTAYQFSSMPPSPEELSEIIADSKKIPDREIHSRLDEIENRLSLQQNSSAPDLLNWQQINEMIGTGIIEAGSHTCNHIRLNEKTESSIIEHEIMASKKLIDEKTGQDTAIFCFPNGDYSADALKLVRQTYKGGVSTKTGWNTADTDNHLLNRIGIHEDIAKDRTAFLARISGWM